MTSGAELRDRGHEQLRMAGTWDDWYRRAERAIRILAASGAIFDSERLRAEIGDPTRPSDMGRIFHQAHRAGLIEPCGFAVAERRERRRGLIRRWQGVPDAS